MDRIGRQIDGMDEDLAVPGETLSLFIRFWLTVTPPLPDSAQASARPKGMERFKRFLQTFGRKLATGDRFLKDLSRDVFMNRNSVFEIVGPLDRIIAVARMPIERRLPVRG
jgi:hypothetical protein